MFWYDVVRCAENGQMDTTKARRRRRRRRRLLASQTLQFGGPNLGVASAVCPTTPTEAMGARGQGGFAWPARG
jgi:hypothetical protein